MRELGQCAALLLSLLSLLAVAHAAFFSVATAVDQRLWPTLGMLLLAATVCLASGFVFAPAAPRKTTVITSLPMLLFWWAASIMVLLYALSWYLETHFLLRSFLRWH